MGTDFLIGTFVLEIVLTRTLCPEVVAIKSRRSTYLFSVIILFPSYHLIVYTYGPKFTSNRIAGRVALCRYDITTCNFISGPLIENWDWAQPVYYSGVQSRWTLNNVMSKNLRYTGMPKCFPHHGFAVNDANISYLLKNILGGPIGTIEKKNPPGSWLTGGCGV